jgi:hypothetical protein
MKWAVVCAVAVAGIIGGLGFYHYRQTKKVVMTNTETTSETTSDTGSESD